MPSVSAKQARTMAAAAHDPKFAKKMKIPVKVAKEFNKADKGTGVRKKKSHADALFGHLRKE
jgi:ribosome assembly protein YihI (activator of Der GTPase)